MPAVPALRDLVELPLIAHEGSDVVHELLRSQGIELRVVLRAGMSATVEAMVAAGLGAGRSRVHSAAR